MNKFNREKKYLGNIIRNRDRGGENYLSYSFNEGVRSYWLKKLETSNVKNFYNTLKRSQKIKLIETLDQISGVEALVEKLDNKGLCRALNANNSKVGEINVDTKSRLSTNEINKFSIIPINSYVQIPEEVQYEFSLIDDQSGNTQREYIKNFMVAVRNGFFNQSSIKNFQTFNDTFSSVNVGHSSSDLKDFYFKGKQVYDKFNNLIFLRKFGRNSASSSNSSSFEKILNNPKESMGKGKKLIRLA